MGVEFVAQGLSVGHEQLLTGPGCAAAASVGAVNAAIRRIYANAIDPGTEDAVKWFLSRIAQRYDMAGALLYGSRARGTNRPDSDADLAVLLRGERQRLLPTALAMADLAHDVLLETGINIAPLPIWTDEWENPETYSNPALLQNIAREGVRVIRS
jgi:uncharacterized protein